MFCHIPGHGEVWEATAGSVAREVLEIGRGECQEWNKPLIGKRVVDELPEDKYEIPWSLQKSLQSTTASINESFK
jgi:hypothetical protein